MTEIVAPSVTGDELAPPRLHEFPHSSDRVPPGRISRGSAVAVAGLCNA